MTDELLERYMEILKKTATDLDTLRQLSCNICKASRRCFVKNHIGPAIKRCLETSDLETAASLTSAIIFYTLLELSIQLRSNGKDAGVDLDKVHTKFKIAGADILEL